MAIKIKCRKCEAKFSVKDAAAGRRVKCRECGAPIKVPAPKPDEEDLLDFDTAAYGDEPSGDDPYRDDASTGTQPPPRRRKKNSGNKRAAASGGKKSSGSNRGLTIGLSAGGGLLVIALLAMAFWPEKPSPEVADGSDGDNAESSSTTYGDPTSPTEGTATDPSTPVTATTTTPSTSATASTTSPSAPAAASVTNLEGDLNFLQGTWQITDVESSTEQPLSENAVSNIKSTTWTFKDDILFMSRANEIYSTSSVSPNSTASPRTLDITDLDGNERAGRINPAIYSIDEETLKVCMSTTRKDPLRPRELKPKADQLVFTLTRTSLPTNADSPLATSGAQFDFKAWIKAAAKLKAMKVSSALVRRRADSTGFPDGLTHYAFIDSIAADGSISAKLWEVISSVSHVAVRTSSISDAAVTQLSQHPGLVSLNISGRSTVTANGIAKLRNCPNLRSLAFSGVPVSPAIFSVIAQLSELTFFGIRNTPVSGELAGTIVSLNKLKSLSIMDAPVSGEIVDAIVSLNKLKVLNLQNTGIADEDLVQIAKLTELRTLLLGNYKVQGKSRVTDKGVQSLKSLTELRQLSLSNFNVSDKGLQSLKSLTKLTLLQISGSSISRQALADFEAAVPECRVQK
ncbi:MAG: TIGR03067 domain-containing protein [Fuerstiella sp.]